MKILIVDDEKRVRFAINRLFKKEGDQIFEAESGERALDFLEENSVDAAIVDYQMPGMNGIELLKVIKEKYPALQVLIITAFGDEKVAIQAIKAGAYDYIKKPFDNQVLTNRMSHIRSHVEANKEKGPTYYGSYFSSKTKGILQKIETIAQTGLPLLVTGESGTGKELIAKTCHSYSGRKGPFIAINCSALPETLIESELFGAEKGAYTGADKRKIGFFELAQGGTIFLDEISEMPLEMQAKLLRVLQEREIVRVGGGLPVAIDARVIAATNKDIALQTASSLFREDLYYRLNGVNIHLPPLRERQEEIEALAQLFLQKFNKQYEKTITGFTDEVLESFHNYRWPGNIREMQNKIEQAVVFCREQWIGKSYLSLDTDQEKKGEDSKNEQGALSFYAHFPGNLTEAKAQFEKEYLHFYLKQCLWNIKKTATTLGIYRQDLHKKIKKYGLSKE